MYVWPAMGHLYISVTVQNGDSALTMVVRESKNEVVSLLLEAGATVDLHNKVWRHYTNDKSALDIMPLSSGSPL